VIGSINLVDSTKAVGVPDSLAISAMNGSNLRNRKADIGFRFHVCARLAKLLVISDRLQRLQCNLNHVASFSWFGSLPAMGRSIPCPDSSAATATNPIKEKNEILLYCCLPSGTENVSPFKRASTGTPTAKSAIIA
jgi:hypothetical protein